jgi:hypothetical protein
MKRVVTLALASVLSSPFLLAQNPTWAEELFRIKVGQKHPDVQRREKEQRLAREQQQQQQRLSELFSKLDLNGDGVISNEEWRQSTAAAASDPAAK